MHRGRADVKFPARRTTRTAVPAFATPSPCLLVGVCVFDFVVDGGDAERVVAPCGVERWAIVVGMAAEDALQNDVPTAAAALVDDALVVDIVDDLPSCHYVLHAASDVAGKRPALLLERSSSLPHRRVAESADRHRCESCGGAAAEYAADDAGNTASFECPPDRE
mmetsp:Transcript_32347/g.95310  ORF Transcript_32347/g.95310 Transcript_32347/m.95310 type:complete len:165 (-) Transcript_32347:131-625(-)